MLPNNHVCPLLLARHNRKDLNDHMATPTRETILEANLGNRNWFLGHGGQSEDMSSLHAAVVIHSGGICNVSASPSSLVSVNVTE